MRKNKLNFFYTLIYVRFDEVCDKSITIFIFFIDQKNMSQYDIVIWIIIKI
jgi:hypothetical protein